MSKLPSGVACVGCSSGGSGALVRLAVLVVAVASATAQVVPRSVPGQIQESDEAPAQTSPIEGVGYAQGSDGARLEVVELLDSGCSVCAAFAAQSYPVLRDRYVLAGEVRWLAIPFVLGSFRRSSEAARAGGLCTRPGGVLGDARASVRASGRMDRGEIGGVGVPRARGSARPGRGGLRPLLPIG